MKGRLSVEGCGTRGSLDLDDELDMVNTSGRRPVCEPLVMGRCGGGDETLPDFRGQSDAGQVLSPLRYMDTSTPDRTCPATWNVVLTVT